MSESEDYSTIERLDAIELNVAAVLASQERTEEMVREFIAAVKPTVEAFSKGGLMGMLGGGRGIFG